MCCTKQQPFSNPCEFQPRWIYLSVGILLQSIIVPCFSPKTWINARINKNSPPPIPKTKFSIPSEPCRISAPLLLHFSSVPIYLAKYQFPGIKTQQQSKQQQQKAHLVHLHGRFEGDECADGRVHGMGRVEQQFGGTSEEVRDHWKTNIYFKNIQIFPQKKWARFELKNMIF